MRSGAGLPVNNLERVVWLDHVEPHSDNVWWTPDDLDAVTGPAVIASVGWVIREEPTWLLLVSQLADDGWTGRPLVIVKSCVVLREPLGNINGIGTNERVEEPNE